MNSKLQGGQQRKAVDINTIKKLPSSTLKEALIEFNHEQARSEEVGRLLQSELANRELSGREDEEEEQEEEDQQEVTAAQAAGALDEEDKDEIVQEAMEEEEMGPSEGVSTKGISTGDANNALDADNASLPSEIKDHYESYEKTAKDIENLDTEID
jgi:ribosomal protein S25